MIANDSMSMQIAHIRIKNFRIIRNLDMDCAERMNVFVGVNGAGKSTFLEALKFLFSWFIARVNNMNGRGLSLTDDDISVGEDFCSLEIRMANGVSWSLYRQRAQKRSKPTNQSELAIMTRWANEIVEKYDEWKGMSCLPVFARYGVNRAVTELPMQLRKKYASRLKEVYDNTSLNSGLNFRDFFEWLREREDLENEYLRERGVLMEDAQVGVVREALRRVFPDYGEFKINRNTRSFLMKKGEETFDFEHLSDGEKCYITLVADIARRLAIANPHGNPLEGYGVILIDEVDLHLHPSWESEVITKLRDIFPNCQFFVTTHSPFVVSNIKTFDKEKFIPISNGEILQHGMNPFGQPVDMILLNLFNMSNLRNREVKERIDRLWSYLEKGDDSSAEFEQDLEWLKQHLDVSDSEFVRIALERAKIRKRAL